MNDILMLKFYSLITKGNLDNFLEMAFTVLTVLSGSIQHAETEGDSKL